MMMQGKSQQRVEKAAPGGGAAPGAGARGFTRPRVLLVEDEADLADLMDYNLRREGFDVTLARDGEQAIALLKTTKPDLILLDLMLPGVDGLEVCRAVRADARLKGTPVVMVTAKNEEADIVSGLELGADDYIPKPFSPKVLVARVKAVLRRGKAAKGEQDDQTLHVGTVKIVPERHEVLISGVAVELTATEFRVLLMLARRPGRVFTRQQIIEAIHGHNTAVTERSVDVQVVSLRRKLGQEGDRIQTIRGVGYRLKEEE